MRPSANSSLSLFKLFAMCLTLAASSIMMSSYNRVANSVDDLWKQLGISQQQGADKIKNSFMSGYLDYWGIKNFKNIAAADRAALAKDLLSYTKTYLNTPTVKSAYLAERQSARPIAEEAATLTREDIRKREVTLMKKTIAEAEKLLKQFPDMEKSVRKTIQQFEQNIVDLEKPDSKIIEIYYESQAAENKSKEMNYAESLKRWEENYPADYRVKLKGYLTKYLAEASTVDFNAALTEKYNKKVFVNGLYEGKNDEWKMIFRAGKEVYDVAAPFAEQWLKELSVK